MEPLKTKGDLEIDRARCVVITLKHSFDRSTRGEGWICKDGLGPRAERRSYALLNKPVGRR
jgi:hypothetical protein